LVISTTNNQCVSLCEFPQYVDQNNLEYFVTDAFFFLKEKKIILFEEMSSQLPPTGLLPLCYSCLEKTSDNFLKMVLNKFEI
jgi:hypothetical protein